MIKKKTVSRLHIHIVSITKNISRQRISVSSGRHEIFGDSDELGKIVAMRNENNNANAQKPARSHNQ